jgi:hypothetical protein
MSKPKPEVKAAAKTRCEEGPAEDLVPQDIPRAQMKDVIELNLFICKANSQVLVYLDGAPVRKENGKDQVSLTLPNLSPGFHQLYWSVFGVGDKGWQTRAEIKINGAVSFLRRRTSDDNNPSLTGFWVVEIV